MTTILGRVAFLRLLQEEGVSCLFGNPGTTELAIMSALPDFPDLRYVLGLQEALVVAMADGYARASGRLAACNVHVAPGLGNALGAIYNAKWYGSPVLVTAGQQEQGHGLTEPLLYEPLLPMVAPLVKWAVEVTRLQDLPRVLRRAAKVALTPPTGPVFISLPGDILDAAEPLDLLAPTRVDTRVVPAPTLLAQLADALLAANHPVLLAGHELATGDALAEAAALAEVLGAPVHQQTVPCAAHFLSEHPAFLGALTRSQPQVRAALAEYDLLVCLGSDVLRMSVQHEVDPLPPGLRVVQIGQRDWEMGKNYPASLAIRADLKETLRALVPLLRERGGPEQQARAAQRLAEIAKRNWSAKRLQLRAEVEARDVLPMDPRLLMLRLSESLPNHAVVVEEGLSSTTSLLGFLPLRDAQGYYGLASGGIGFAIAGAVGISLALPGRPVVAIIGDGSALYGIQALWTAAHLRLPITYVIANNRSYRILKERLVSLRGTNRFVGMDLRDPAIDFVALSGSLGVPGRRLSAAAEIGPALRQCIAAGGPHLLEVEVEDGFGG